MLILGTKIQKIQHIVKLQYFCICFDLNFKGAKTTSTCSLKILEAYHKPAANK